MPQMNAKQQMQSATQHLEDARECLNEALRSVEKPENREKIAGTLNSIDRALQTAVTSISDYED